ncbi:MAG: hypothetical protein Q9227_005695 [Pyrenula ochraceoflavens]
MASDQDLRSEKTVQDGKMSGDSSQGEFTSQSTASLPSRPTIGVKIFIFAFSFIVLFYSITISQPLPRGLHDLFKFGRRPRSAYPHSQAQDRIQTSSRYACLSNGEHVLPNFNLPATLSTAHAHARHSWEYGVLAEALLELDNPELSVFSSSPFPNNSLPPLAHSPNSTYPSSVPSLALALSTIDPSHRSNILMDGDGSPSDPASLGVSALLLGQILPAYADAASRQVSTLLDATPRFSNGAISHRAATAEVWGDFVYMVPPFLAYYAVAQGDDHYLREAVRQCALHRDALLAGSEVSKIKACRGAWKHFVVGPEGGEFSGQEGNPALWATSNGWAAAGMVRVLATLYGWKGRGGMWKDEEGELVGMIIDILDCVVEAPAEELSGRGPLLRNHLDDEVSFGEAAGTALLVSVVYRMVVLNPDMDWNRYLAWADRGREAVSSCVSESTGIIAPVNNWSDWHDTKPCDRPSSEAQSFAILMYSAYRDCICLGYCKHNH